MPKKNLIARPYAKALFEIAKSENQINEWSQALAQVALVASDSKMISLLKHPQFSEAQSIELILELVPDLSDSMKSALDFIAESKRLLFLPEIETSFQRLKAQEEQALKVNITLARPLVDSDFEEKITAALTKRFNKEKVVVHFDYDPSVIGGAVIKTGDEVIDLSVRGRLVQMRDALRI